MWSRDIRSRKMRPRKGPNGTAWLPVGALLVCLAALWTSDAPRAAPTELFVGDESGIALYGFDPVAFFVDQAPRKGLPAFELSHAGAVFRFRNEGNRAAFKANPGIYLPRFGGYDPIAVGRGSPAPGSPGLFLIRENRLFFFSNEKSRKSFLANPQEALAAAEFSWPKVMRGLVH
jgi:YHS domain-containing protein